MGQRSIRNKSQTRFCMPFTVKCTNCNEFIRKNKRHNTSQEEIKGGDYYGIKVYRFIFKCTGCKENISIKTDPKNGKYAVDYGCINIGEDNKQTLIIDSLSNIDKLKEDIYNLYEIEKNNKKKI